ncbi:hypothetical protein RFI_26366 [Reticulomyxa filosa]|uniref:Uncharacterized protein n=1 Tax=Reticulomyxa filosa TaxID=46433 RepID=X6MD93_RETFI|nr:hypothetical protein RFI_26366 [Reticulomyxa filosa]|eukprot:ETO11010.1 hypothetical protein RFI_26366 [Reticulomyxa filosa]
MQTMKDVFYLTLLFKKNEKAAFNVFEELKIILNKIVRYFDIVDEKQEIKTTNETTDTVITKAQDICEKYFKRGNVAKFKMIFDILLWKPNTIGGNIAKQQQFEIYIQQLFSNRKLLNEEMEIIQFIAERIHDTNPIFVNLKPILSQIIGASKTNEHVVLLLAFVTLFFLKYFLSSM